MDRQPISTTPEPTLQPETPSASLSTPPQKIKLPLVLGGILVLFFVGFAGFLLGQKLSQPKTPPQVQIAPTPPIPTPTPDLYTEQSRSATADWKTYTNKKCGYEVKYPPSWSLLPEPEDALFGAAVIFPYEVGSGVKTPADWLKVQIGCANKEVGADPRTIVDQLNKRDTGYGVPKIEGLEKINLKGNLAFKQVTVPPMGDSVLEYYIFPEGNKYYSLAFTPSYTKLTTIIDQILSTFQFLD